MILRIAAFALAAAIGAIGTAQGIYPAPQQESVGPAGAPIKALSIQHHLRAMPQVKAFQEDWGIAASQEAIPLRIWRDPSLMKEEEYRIELGRSAVVRYGGETGMAWGLESLGQLLDQGVRQGTIADRPNVSFRALLVDVARRYHSISTIRTLVQWCQASKVRYMVLHLTDDQSWMLPTASLPGIDAKNHHGKPAYTRKELEDLQAFASARGVTIIPEVDLPGHTGMLCGYAPEIFRIPESPSGNCINFASPDVIRRVQEIVIETAEIFADSPYFHIGGDEAWYPNIEKTADMARARRELGGDASVNDVFVDFLGQMSDTLIRAGKKPLIWEGFARSEFAPKRLKDKATVIAWEGRYHRADHLLEDGFEIINAGWDPYYVVGHYPYDSFTLAPLPQLRAADPGRFGAFEHRNSRPDRVTLKPMEQVKGTLMCWWEGHEWHAQTILPPRIMAYGASQWSDATASKRRTESAARQVNAALYPFSVTVAGETEPGSRQFVDSARIAAEALNSGATVESTHEEIAEDAVVQITARRAGKQLGESWIRDFAKVEQIESLSFRKRAFGSTEEDPQFPARLLTDGIADDISSFWLAYPLPAAATIDLGRVQQISRIEVVPFWAAGQGLTYAVEVSASGESWAKAAEASKETKPPGPQGHVHTFAPADARWVRVSVTDSSQFPTTMARIHEVRVFASPD